MAVSRRVFLKAGGALVASLGTPGKQELANAATWTAPVVSGKVPVLGNARMHQQQNWLADWIPPTLAKGRALPWTLGADLPNGILAYSKKGAVATRVQAWHVWGNPTELYSEVPWFDPQGRSHPYNAQTSDDFASIVADLAVRPPADGPRGLCMPVSQATVIPHPTIFPAVDATLAKSPNTGYIPRAPLVIWLRHDAFMQFGYADGRVVDVGRIPGIVHSHDACIDGRFMTVPRARKLVYVCDLGQKDAKGNWSGGRIVLVDRLPGAVAPGGTPPEDPSKYVVTTMAQAGYPTAVRSDETGAVYFIDDDKGGEITKIPYNGVPTRLCTVASAFALDYANGKLYVACKTGEVHIVDAVTGAVGPNLMPPQYLFPPFQRGVDFMTISVDANGTCGPVGTFMCSRVHTNGNVNTWQFSPDGTVCKYGNAVYNSGQGWNTCGDAHSVHEIFGHYDWIGGKYHIDQAVQFVGGYANSPVGVLVFDPPYPAQATVDYTAVWRGMKNICRGGPIDDKQRPSLTCLMTREGWSPFAGCSNDEIAEMPFDAAQAWIQGGYAGSFPRPDITGVDLYCVMLLHLVNSQRHIREGASFIASFQAWWKAKYGLVPAAPADTVGVFTTTPALHLDGNAIPYRLEVRESAPGQYTIGIFGSYSNDTRYGGIDYNGNPNVGTVPSNAVIMVDEGTAQQTTWPGTLTPGWHSFTVRASGWTTGAVSYFVPSGGTQSGSHGNPGISYSPAGTRNTSAGVPLVYSISVQNNDTVATGSTFDVTAVVPRGWSATSVRTPSVVPGGHATVTITITAPASAAPALYTLTFKATSTADATKAATTTAVVSIGSSSFSVSVTSMQASYVRPSNGTSYAPITTQVVSGGLAVAGASVVVTVRDPAGAVTTYSGSTRSVSGKVYTYVPFTRANAAGIYTVSVVATLGGISSSSATNYVLK